MASIITPSVRAYATSIVKVVAGAAVAAAASYVSQHSAADPTIAVAVALAVREVDHLLGTPGVPAAPAAPAAPPAQ